MSEAKKYNPSEIEKKWQDYWREHGTYTTKESGENSFYILDMFPYPSGEGLHVGHPKGYIATDIYSRLKRMQGFDVLHPMGFDAFGLPAEQYAIKNKLNPRSATEKNVARYKEQLEILGLDYDWDREVNTTDPKFYKWTQWMWKQMYQDGLAYESYDPINWCPSCKTGLANEDLDGNLCERCGSVVEKKSLRQWTIRITDYADRLLEDLDKLDWEPHIKELQRNWIGKNVGVKYTLQVKDTDIAVETYSTHFEAFYADTFAVIAADHKLLPKIISGVQNESEILEQAEQIKTKKASLGFKDTTEHEGFFTGRYLIDPITSRELPLWISSYALSDYGTGIIKCSAHDARDFAFAKKYDLPLHTVMYPEEATEKVRKEIQNFEYCYNDFNTAIIEEPNEFFGKKPKIAHDDIVEYLVNNNFAVQSTQYKLRDWVFARQRYWGEPFPIVFDENHTSYAVADSELPVVLPDVENYEPTGTGESPLAAIEDWVNVYGYINQEGEFESIDMSSFDFDKTEFMDINLAGGSDTYVSGAPIVERKNVAVIVKHPTEDKYLVSKWKASVWNGWLTGGIEDGDTPEDTARTEVREESGYTDIASVDIRDFSVHSLFYHPVKKQNRLAHYRLAIAELASLDKEAVSEEEQAICDFVWVDKKDIVDTLTRDEMKSLWAEYIGSDEVYESKIKQFKRETNTMPQWAGSSWYYLRYIDPHNTERFADAIKEKKWSPVDFYVGGAEHATRHLIYARFWHKYLFDKGLLSHDEPFTKLQTVGLITAEDGRKMSKRWGNVVNPDDVIAQYGADTLRLYEMFMGPFDQSAMWSTQNITGSRRFLDRVYNLQNKVADSNISEAADKALHNTIKKVTEDVLAFKHNTAISALMTLQNILEKETSISKDVYMVYLQLIAPFAPHMTEELWHAFGNSESIHISSWPVYDTNKLVSETMTISIQVNGKLRGTVEVGTRAEKETILSEAKLETNVSKWLEGKKITKEIYVPNKLVNFVVEN
jgi:leucyl-tRNA synthetase